MQETTVEKVLDDSYGLITKNEAENLTLFFYDNLKDEIPDKRLRHEKAMDFAIFIADKIIGNVEPSLSMDTIEGRVKMWEDIKEEISKYRIEYDDRPKY